ncbi:MAG TPA: response regulator [Elusimicrobiota bacterium]|nr:response regulator [Elusimicrobiota bacterium]
MAPPAEHPFSILVVDDEADNRTILKSQLEKVPHSSLTVDVAADGDEALKKLREGLFDLVFLDYRLPTGDGLEVLDKIRQHHPKTAVVMTTAAGSEQIAVAAMKKGAMDYMSHKDLRAADLGQLLRRVAEIRDLVNQNMELRQVNQMKNEFIANVSHELRTPLTVVIGYANTLHDGSLGPMTEPQQKALVAIVERAEGLLQTLNNILRIREVHEGHKPLLLKPIDLKALAEAQLARAAKDIRRKKLSVSAALGGGPVWVLAEEEKLGDVVDNLLSNATKFSPAEGELKVALSSAGGKASLTVADRGPGVPPELMPHVFERFFAANQGPTREYPGLGLGLPLSKEIVEQHGGRIWLESQGAGTGATAHLELPVCAADAPPTVVEGAAETLRKKRVLIVEDNPDLVEVLMLFLATLSRNVAITTARSGFEALEKIKDETPNLVILDVMMPGMDGFEVLARLRRVPDTERVPVMVLTGYSDAVERAREAGAQEVLLKPFEKNVFIKKVLHLLQDAKV